MIPLNFKPARIDDFKLKLQAVPQGTKQNSRRNRK